MLTPRIIRIYAHGLYHPPLHLVSDFWRVFVIVNGIASGNLMASNVTVPCQISIEHSLVNIHYIGSKLQLYLKMSFLNLAVHTSTSTHLHRLQTVFPLFL